MATQPLRFFITGGGRGLGRGLTAQLIQQGHECFVVDANQTELTHTLSTYLPSLNASGKFAGDLCDVSSSSQIQASLSKAGSFFREGKIDCLVNNAGLTSPYWPDGGDFVNADESEWQRYLAVNLSGPFNVTRLAVPLMVHDGTGSVVHISSTRSKQSEPNQEGYASTKAGLLGLTHSMASSLADPKYRIRVNAILPGWIPSTHESKKGDEEHLAWDSELNQEDQAQHWAGRAGHVDDLTKTVLYLATTGFINGQEIVIDGGITKKMIYVE